MMKTMTNLRRKRQLKQYFRRFAKAPDRRVALICSALEASIVTGVLFCSLLLLSSIFSLHPKSKLPFLEPARVGSITWPSDGTGNNLNAKGGEIIANYSGYSPEVVVTAGTTPSYAPPTNFSATPGDNSVALAWTLPNGATGVEISRKTGTGAYAVLATLGVSQAFNDTAGTVGPANAPVNGTTYTYKLRAIYS
jgi:hypothetical protein